jgi:hypothetical protein
MGPSIEPAGADLLEHLLTIERTVLLAFHGHVPHFSFTHFFSSASPDSFLGVNRSPANSISAQTGRV